MKAQVGRGVAVSLGVERMVHLVVSEMALRAQQIAEANDERVQDLSMQVGELSQKVVALTTALANSEANVESLRIENESLRSQAEFALSDVRGAA